MSDSISFEHARYPPLLKQISNSPKEIFYCGDWRPELFENCLAVVGSRRMTEYGKVITQRLVYEIAARGVTIVSGFMYGVDMTAHKAALAAGGKTVAVLAYGIKREPPRYLSKIYQEIIDLGGLVISELQSNEPPKKWSFPKRNRIIAGLSQAVLVVEAELKSGSLITADFAKEYQREIFAVPGPINSANSQGTLKLISEGAKMITDSKQILEFFEISAEKSSTLDKAKKFAPKNSLRNEIITSLRQQPASIEEIAEIVDQPASQLNSQITSLILAGQIREESGRFYVDYR